jgi:delta24-sterol reductase
MVDYNIEDHKKAVATISSRVSHFYQTKKPFRIYHGSTNSTRHTLFDPSSIVDTSPLIHILSISAPILPHQPLNTTANCVVQSNVPMDQLVSSTLRHGYIPKIVPEFPGITVGGAFAGTAGESTSWKYGFFDRSINWVEMVLADGRVVRATPTSVLDENGDPITDEEGSLFLGAAGGMGTYGVATLLEVQLLPVNGGETGFVELEYRTVTIFEEAKTHENIVFMDGILFSPSHGVVVLGNFSSGIGTTYSKVRFTRRCDPWFYLHAQEAKNHHRELVPIFDYLFRYDRGAFWMASHMFGHSLLFPFNKFNRWLWDSLTHTREQYKLMHARGAQNSVVVQDIMLPRSSVGPFVRWNSSENEGLQIWPLWLCPFHADSKTAMHQLPSNSSEELSINVGIWGMGSLDYDDNVQKNKDLERKVQELGGRKWLYGQVFYTEEEFWQIYDQERIMELRKRWKAETLSSIWEKVRNKETGKTLVSNWQLIKNYRRGEALLKKKGERRSSRVTKV